MTTHKVHNSSLLSFCLYLKVFQLSVIVQHEKENYEYLKTLWHSAIELQALGVVDNGTVILLWELCK